MAYVHGNPKTKKELKQWIEEGRIVTVFDPGPFGTVPNNGTVLLEGPHFPQPHKWYARGTIKDGKLVSVT